MATVIIPVAISAVGGYLLLKHGILEPFRDVISRQTNQVGAIQQLQLRLYEITSSVDIYVDDANPTGPGTYRVLRQQIELAFGNLREELKRQTEVLAIVSRAREEWTSADHLGAEIMVGPHPMGDPHALELMEQFSAKISAAVDRLSAANDMLKQDLDRDYAHAHLTYERSEWVTGIAAAVSLLFIVLGVLMIGRLILANVNRLVEGATHFAEGDLDYRIEIEVPRELRRVAGEFNRMIRRIRDAETVLADQAQRDALTGLLNRRSFDQSLSEALARQKRFGEPFALCMLDLDHFKKVNDTYGHSAGDELLRVVGRKMTLNSRQIDKVFRIGGEEFVILLPNSDADGALASAERLRAAIAAEPINAEGQQIFATVSIGVAVPSTAADGERVMKEADMALYQAKADGRNCVRPKTILSAN